MDYFEVSDKIKTVLKLNGYYNIYLYDYENDNLKISGEHISDTAEECCNRLDYHPVVRLFKEINICEQLSKINYSKPDSRIIFKR